MLEKKIVDESEIALSSSIGKVVVDHSYIEYQLCKDLGITPMELEDMPAATYDLFHRYMLMDIRLDKVRAKRAEQKSSN